MAKFAFTATHGVALHDLKVKFTFDREATGTSSAKVYTFETDDAALAKKVGAIKDYGIKAASSTEA
ncbi:MAG: hypothetical protein ACRDTJ_04390 [Pseudonocardiaceae bacterium]